MKYAYLVAWREFTENIKTKGFWIGICLFPTILFLSIQIPVLLEKKGHARPLFCHGRSIRKSGAGGGGPVGKKLPVADA